MPASPAQEALRHIFLNPVMPIMMIGMGYMLFLVTRAATARAVLSVSDGQVIPVKATFAGVRIGPSGIAVASNNASPLFIIRPEGIEYRVLRRQKRAWADIELIDVRTTWRTVNIEMQFRGALLTFAANVGDAQAAHRALALVPAGTPMTARASAIRAVGPEHAMAGDAHGQEGNRSPP